MTFKARKSSGCIFISVQSQASQDSDWMTAGSLTHPALRTGEVLTQDYHHPEPLFFYEPCGNFGSDLSGEKRKQAAGEKNVWQAGFDA